MKRLVIPATAGSSWFVLKGTGWYVTDYARKEKKDSGSGDKGDKGEPKAGRAA